MLEKLFGFDRNKSSVRTEVIAGITTFLTMAYILAVNPNILAETGMDRGALFTTTVLMSALPTIAMALYAKLPLALAPGMGLNAFFAYTVCIVMGYSWQFALTAVFVEGLIFVLLTLTHLREKIVDVIPDSLKYAIGGGIGLFIAFIGLSGANVIVKSDATLIELGNLAQGEPMLCVIGIITSSVLLVLRVKGALLMGILFTTLLGIPLELTRIDHMWSMPPSIEPIFMQFEWQHLLSKDMLLVVFTLLFLDLFDSIGTVIGVATRIGLTNEQGKITRLKEIFMVDSLATTTGAMMGSSTVTVYLESTAGVNEGGKSGLTAFVTGICFLLSLFLAPLFLAIPTAATAPALVLVGVMMMAPVLKINFNDFSEAIPAFICILMMPLCYSISDGIVLGQLSYVIINLLSGNHRKLTTGMYVLSAFFLLKFLV